MPAKRRRQLFPLPSFSEAQREVIKGLMKHYRDRQWWLVVKNPQAPKDCSITDGLCLRFDHPHWTAGPIPCSLKGCNCTIWAITGQEAFYHSRQSVPVGGDETNCRSCRHWQGDICA